MLSVNRSERIGKLPRRLLGSAVRIDRAAAAAVPRQSNVGPRLLQRTKLREHPGFPEGSDLVGRYGDASLRRVSMQVPHAERIYVFRSKVESVGPGIVLLVFEIQFGAVDKIVGVVGPAVLIVGFCEAEKN